MLKVIELIQKNMAEQIKLIYGIELPSKTIVVEIPQNEKFGDYSCNIAMVIAKDLKQSPIEIAKRLSYELQELPNSFTLDSSNMPLFSNIEAVAPGFINFHYSDNWLLSLLISLQSENTHYGSSTIMPVHHIALEHSNVNPNKAPHIGHLRNAAIGVFIEKIYEFLGQNVNVQYYSNDVGAQVATSFLGSKEVSTILPQNYNRFDYYAWDIYAEISTQLEDDPILKSKLDKILQVVEDPDDPLSKEVASFADKVLADQIQTFNELGITYDVIIHERDIVYTKMWEKCFEILKKNPNFYLATHGKSAGCWLLKNTSEQVSTEQDDFEKDKIIVRSNGVPTYTGKDIAYHMWKFGLLDKDFGYENYEISTQHADLYQTRTQRLSDETKTFSYADSVIDVIDQKQTYAINAVKEALLLLGYAKQAQNMQHINYGFVYLSLETAMQLGLKIHEGMTRYEMSGRKGIGVKILDFIKLVDSRMATDYGDFPAKKEVRNGAILFEMLKYNTYNDLVFDIDTALNVKGFSGPYIQYTHARICSVLKKAENTNIKIDVNFNTSTVDIDALLLIRQLARFDEIVQRSALEFAPNLLCEYLFKVSKLFNAFYNDHSFIGAESPELRDFRLNVGICTRIVLRNGLQLLGIVAPERV